MIDSYPSIFNLGHNAIATLLHGPVIVEEKVDGSQISFRRTEEGIEIRSKGAVINTVAPEGMFKGAVATILELGDRIPLGYTFRGEYLAKPKHNILHYSRVPENGIAIFDIEQGQQNFLSPLEKQIAAKLLGFESVPALFGGLIGNPDELRQLLEIESFLGGQKIEGVVIKPLNYDLYGRDKKVLMGKFVSEEFKETHASDWKKEHGPKSSNDILRELAVTYSSPARWQKALIHLREAGKITDSPKDIGELMAAVPPDILKECEEEIKAMLFKWAWPILRRSVTKGLADWYKDILLKRQFENQPEGPVCPSLQAQESF